MIKPLNLKFYLSGGDDNQDPSKSIGGARSKRSVIGPNLFPNVTSQQAAQGLVTYRCVYFVNEDASEDGLMEPVRMWLREIPKQEEIAIAIDASGKNGVAPRMRDGKPPSGLHFVVPVGRDTALVFPDSQYLEGDHIAIWIRRRVPAMCKPVRGSSFSLIIEGDTL